MAISTRTPLSAGQKTASLAILYFVQGLPYGFQDKLVPLVLIVRGHSASSVALTRLLFLPWLAKPLLAPLIETTLTKAKWVKLSLLSLAAISLFNVTSEPESDGATAISPQLSSTLFTLNLFSAIQDIAVDAIAIAVLSSGGEVANGNAAQIVGYKLGAFFGSGVLFWIYNTFSLKAVFIALFSVYITVLAVFQLIIGSHLVETIESDQWPSLMQVFSQLRRPSLLSHVSPSMKNLLCYLMLYKLGETAATTTLPFFLTRSGVSSSQIAFWNTVAMLFSIVGSTLASRLSLSHLQLTLQLRLLPLFLQLMLVGLAGSHFDAAHHPLLYYCSMLSLVTLHFIGGAITTLTSLMMIFTCQSMPASFRATRYTIMTSIEILGKLMFASLSGWIVDQMGFTWAHLLYWLLSIWPLLFLTGLDITKEVAKRH